MQKKGNDFTKFCLMMVNEYWMALIIYSAIVVVFTLFAVLQLILCGIICSQLLSMKTKCNILRRGE